MLKWTFQLSWVFCLFDSMWFLIEFWLNPHVERRAHHNSNWTLNFWLSLFRIKSVLKPIWILITNGSCLERNTHVISISRLTFWLSSYKDSSCFVSSLNFITRWTNIKVHQIWEGTLVKLFHFNGYLNYHRIELYLNSTWSLVWLLFRNKIPFRFKCT